MSLPVPGMDFTAFDTLPAASLDDMVENIEALADGSGLNAGGSSSGIANSKLKTGAGEPGGAWDSWTPTYTNLTIGSGTVVAKYKQIGKIVHFRWIFTYGAGSAVGTSPLFTLPVTAASGYIVGPEGADIGVAKLLDAGVINVKGTTTLSSTTTVGPQVIQANGTYASAAGIAPTIPFTWATGDAMYCVGTYEAA